jgi:hypothetical protein
VHEDQSRDESGPSSARRTEESERLDMINQSPTKSANVTFLDAAKPDKEVTLQAKSEGNRLSPLLQSELAAHLNRCWERAKNEKNVAMQERLLKCERQRRGVYDPDKAADIAKTGGSNIYMMLTDVKCRAAESWIKDVLASAGTDVFDLDPAQNPELPPEFKKQIIDTVRIEAIEAVQAGGQITPADVAARLNDIHDRALFMLRQGADKAATRMEARMRDQLHEGGYELAFNDFVNDFVSYPTAIVKGPVVKRKARMTWGPKYEPVQVNDLVQTFTRVSPFDIYPSPGSSGPNDGYLIERHRLLSPALFNMIGVPGYNSKALTDALEAYPHGYKNWLMGDTERDLMEGKNLTWQSEEIDVLEFWGTVSGKMLKDWGYKGDLEKNRPYEINAWWIGPFVIKAVINPHPLGARPYSVSSWQRIPGAFWGVALPELMTDIQTVCNAAARALANNMAISSGPQVEVIVDRLPEGEDITSVFPWKIWQVTSDKTGGGQRGVNFFTPTSNAAELMGIYMQFSKQADEITGIPNYVYGSANVSGAGRTASGLSMLMDNASKGIKQAIANIDMAIDGVVSRLYVQNMIFDSDTFIKGDFRVNTRGAMGLISREQQAQNKREFLAQTANPIDLQIMGLDGRRYLLKEIARSLQMDTDKLVPEPKPQPMGTVPQGVTPPPAPPGQPGGSPTNVGDQQGGLPQAPQQPMLAAPTEGVNPQQPQGVSPQGATA